MLTKMTSRAGLLVAAMSIALIAASGVALAAGIIVCSDTPNALGIGACEEGTDEHDTIVGNDLRNIMSAQGANDVLHGMGAADFLDGGQGPDKLNGGAGNDAYFFAPNWGRDVIFNEPSGSDTIWFARQSPTAVVVNLNPSSPLSAYPEARSRAGEQNKVEFPQWVTIETVIGTGSADYIRGNQAGNRLFGENNPLAAGGNDTIIGEGSADVLDGGPGDDNLYGDGPGGTQGRDTIDPGAGRDSVSADGDDDTIIANDGEADQIHCGPGSDYVVYDIGVDSIAGCEITHPR